jgi:hypothetical protein
METFAGIKSVSPEAAGKSCPEPLQKLPGIQHGWRLKAKG